MIARTLNRYKNTLLIARTERTRSHRQTGHLSTLRTILRIVLLGIVIGSGFGAYSVGTGLEDGLAVLPLGTIQVAVTAGFLVLLVGFTQRASRLVARMNLDHLLTTVSTPEVVFGVILSLLRLSRISVGIAFSTLSVALGFAIGARSPAIILTIPLAVVGLLLLTALLGVGLSLAVEYVATRSPCFRRYRSILVVLAFVLILGVGFGVNAGVVSIPLLERGFGTTPLEWFIDLGLLGIATSPSGVIHSVGALGVIGGGIPVLLIATTTLAERVWETEPISVATRHRSHSLIGEGLVERLCVGHVSRPVVTVARKRWLQERRVPRALFMASHLLALLPIVYLPILATARIPIFSPVFLAFVFAATTGFAFGMTPIGTEYPSLSMTLTTVWGKQFIRGELLAGVAIGIPITVVATVVLAWASPLGTLETAIMVVASVVFSVCSMAVAVAVGMKVSYHDLLPAPLPPTSATIYAEIGWTEFVRMGVIVGLLGLLCLPAFGGYLLAFFTPRGTVGGISVVGIRVISLILTAILAIGVSVVAYRQAVRLYDQYTFS